MYFKLFFVQAKLILETFNVQFPENLKARWQQITSIY